MKGNALYKRSTFFIDVINVVLYIDLFLYHEILARMKTDESIEYYFTDGIPKSKEEIGDVWVVHQTAKKSHQNILEDWIDKKKFIEINAIDNHSPEELYTSYVSSLYYDMLTNPICDQYMQVTEFGNAIKLLLKDSKLEKIIFYLPFESQPIIDNLLDVFTGYPFEKLKVFVGEKTPESPDIIADSYVFENVKDVDRLLRKPHRSLTEVLIPTYEYNMAEGRTNFEKLLEQVIYQRLDLEDEDVNYEKEYNLSINTISVPI